MVKRKQQSKKGQSAGSGHRRHLDRRCLTCSVPRICTYVLFCTQNTQSREGGLPSTGPHGLYPANSVASPFQLLHTHNTVPFTKSAPLASVRSSFYAHYQPPKKLKSVVLKPQIYTTSCCCPNPRRRCAPTSCIRLAREASCSSSSNRTGNWRARKRQREESLQRRGSCPGRKSGAVCVCGGV